MYVWWFSGQKPKDVILFSVLLNGLTLPVATFLFNGLLWDFFLVEAIVCIAEATVCTVFWKINFKWGFLVALLANAGSAGAGKILEQFIFAG